MATGEFDPAQHDAFVSERFKAEARRKARLIAFDTLVDMALDGVITMDEAKAEWLAEEAESNGISA